MADSSDFDDVSTVLRAPYKPDERPISAFTVSIVEGPDRGARITLDGAEATPTLVGKSPACNLRLTDREASRRHASLEIAGERVRLEDLGSTNGTLVDGVSVTGALLRGGELVHIGKTVLRIDRAATPPATLASRARSFGKVLGASLEMRRLYPLAERLAASTVSVVIEGETGTGKEVLAESIHEASPRAAGPYVVFDCTTVPANLIEAELFGHEKGAFTGAVNRRRGVFELADKGTLFIDEIGDLELPLQSKLLRAIERSEVRPLGAERAIRVDVRIVAATRRNLDREVQEGRFRDDLFHRLAVGRIELPPLRRRKGDVAVLVEQFWNDLGGAGRPLPNDLVQRWEDEAWPGNVRELRNAVARHLALGDLPREPRFVSDEPHAPASSVPPGPGDVIAEVLALRLPLTTARMRVVEAFEQAYIAQVLAEHGGNVVRAAQASGLARRYFQILKSRFGK